MKLTIPELSLVVLIGSSGSGKSTFAKKHFKPTEVISSDFCRGLVSDDENDQTVTGAAFDVLHYIVSKRLQLGKLTVVDATNVQESARKPLIEIAKDYHCFPVAVVFNLPEKVCQERNKNRTDRQVEEYVIRKHTQQLKKSIKGLQREGFRYVYILNSPEEVEEVVFERQPLWNNKKDEHGPFDIIGDIHGCYDELKMLLEKLGYLIEEVEGGVGSGKYRVTHPEGRKVLFLGDLVDRGPKITEVLKLVMGMVKSGIALCVPGNHDVKLLRKLSGRDVQITHGLDRTLEQLAKEPQEFIEEVKAFIDGLVSHYVLDDGKLVVAHAGMKEEFQGRGSGKVREFALYGETTGETDEYGLPVRYDWASDYRGKALVVYGHTPQAEVLKVNNTINIDTGCVFGGKLTAYRYPEREIVDVKALKTYYEPAKPFLPEEDMAERFEARTDNDILDINDVLGKKIITTRLMSSITIHEENSIAALEVMSRFAADPHWLIYLPPTMSPCETSKKEGMLEHPIEAFEYFRTRGVGKVVCEQKHMGSRAVVIVCRDSQVAEKRFGVLDGTAGICYTRTGRHFFDDMQLEAELIDRVRKVLDKSGFWGDFNTDWVCLDCELMPWSAKAQKLLEEQYSAVGISGRVVLDEAVKLLKQTSLNKTVSFDVSRQTSGKNADINELLQRFTERSEMMQKYVEAYRKYCWPVNSIDDLKLAPFHILATEGKVHSDKNHIWHMDTIAKYCTQDDSLIMATNHILVDVTDAESVDKGIKWWEDLTASGGEGMVVKPYDFIVKNGRELLQPAVKCRGREYLRIIYGPEYTMDENIERLRNRAVGKKRSLALREFSLGMEALERFVRNEPLYRVHECVFGVLALESEPVDPRL
ncbi:polynucleotide 3'-phosphatase /polynucleotide 5'-hydroxyl-kinase /polynucleotide 2',3'-cyclic phosphate phosphodiesterase [Acetivibrio thermocellus AD2]|jgi:protein phosphatase|uniref:Polynucleotide 3'-phosphatase /polynucleotide 5'-hydroxyl-kinase /polynucleotide 2',3'-cyclic phosphate phosphodiesterase n=1 Tax=Acetivibrio thermocellus AD2 TaxID=1138384 RepID=A0AB36TCT1_ACETH|nr:polynucleotide kinase-phosphatase [Acetivibrio thermocellus]CDG37289.1 metallophosphoesterase [Acetivibrio thermocellus BC1]ADU73447.1 metallophosphoesterase [Acetivibrio thermocellus DSM 1313]ALX07369.1 Polynucleotide kinase-phosphatase, bacterial [Acetivibrio thermocellus AD2]ANV75107.1 Polynucleotide kinase-phosphatase, bacterial [Acetivibrio thermocellus DSM 2360]EIC04164.1 metallophosphoesterase [Acetivibrio thermocellus YS]